MTANLASKTGQGSKLFQQDIVQKISSPENYGVVLRCWHDPEDGPPPCQEDDPMMRPLLHGEFGVTFLSHGYGEREILHESDLRLVDRTLQPGDYCKRSVDDLRAGIVTDIKVKGRLCHAISREKVEGWRTLEDLEFRSDAEVGDYVTYNDWIGQVIEVVDEAIAQLPSGQVVRVPDIGHRYAVGDSGPNIVPFAAGGAPHRMYDDSDTDAKDNDTILVVKHNAYAIAWLALNQMLDPAIAENKTRPKRYWYGKDLADLTLIRGRSDLEMRVGDRVYLRDTTGLPYTRHGKEGDPTGVFEVHTYLVTDTVTEIEVIWQDGTKEFLKATEVIPYLNPDEYDCWPGDHVVWKNEDANRAAIVQSVNATDRTALISLPDAETTELAPLLELDPHGTSDNDANNVQTSDGYGVRRGDFVFIHKPGTTNGLEFPKVPRIGELEAWVRENPFINWTLSVWRVELRELGIKVGNQRMSGELTEQPMQRAAQNDGKMLWCGEVTGLNLDGTVQVTHPDWSEETYPLERLTRLYDGMEQLEDFGLESGSEGDDGSEDPMSDVEEQWAMDQDGVWRPEQPNDEWEDVSSADELQIGEEDDGMHQDAQDIMEVDQALWVDEKDGAEVHKDEPTEPKGDGHAQPITLIQEKPSEPGSSDTPISNTPGGNDDDVSDTAEWSRFEILASAPADHAFYTSTPAQPSKVFLGRLNREYRALRSSLPDSIIVRAYEDRTDLLRCLILGPENTPYQDAPFVIDWMLDSNFPHSPPIAHFLSWTNGNGRVNPNLYEEGKVCLSILGTWTGDKSETWNAARSSLLQAFVSIQGLVLVKEPWFCEPAYDKLRGTEEGTVNSRLYSEKAYVLSRGFVRRALEIPLGGLQSEIYHFYYTRRRLHKLIADADVLIEKSRTQPTISPEEQDLAIPRLTAGGIIALERTLAKLRALEQTPPTPPPSSA